MCRSFRYGNENQPIQWTRSAHLLCLLSTVQHDHSLFLTPDNKKKVVVVKLLQSRGYPSDPVKKWKRSVSDDIDEAEGEGEGEEVEEDADYNYLLSMSLWSLTLEKKEEILKKRDEKVSYSYSIFELVKLELVATECEVHLWLNM